MGLFYRTEVDVARVEDQRRGNRLRSALLLVSITSVFLVVASLFFGFWSAVMLAAFSLALVGCGMSFAQKTVLRMQGARPLSPGSAPDLWRMVGQLAAQAGLPRAPRLYLQDTGVPNAFAVGAKGSSSICVSRGLLALLSPKELRGALAHEVAHIRNGDSFAMSVAGHFAGMARILSLFGLGFLALSLPAYLTSEYAFPWLGAALLALAPSAIGLLQLALSRSREFAADLSAAELTQDPGSLASALSKLERFERSLLRRLIWPVGMDAGPRWLRTHPATRERIERLERIERRRFAYPLGLDRWLPDGFRLFGSR